MDYCLDLPLARTDGHLRRSKRRAMGARRGESKTSPQSGSEDSV